MKSWFKTDFKKKNAGKAYYIDHRWRWWPNGDHFQAFHIFPGWKKIDLFVLPILTTPCLYLVEIEWLKFFDKYAGSEGLRIVQIFKIICPVILLQTFLKHFTFHYQIISFQMHFCCLKKAAPSMKGQIKYIHTILHLFKCSVEVGIVCVKVQVF